MEGQTPNTRGSKGTRMGRPRLIAPTGDPDKRLKVIPQRFLPTLPSLLSRPGFPLIHRDLSWFDFNRRVLEQARPTSQNPPIERSKFLAISASNLDEFFMIRVASLEKEIRTKKKRGESDHLRRLKNTILENVNLFHGRQAEILDLIADELVQHGVRIVTDPKIDEKTFEIGKQIFESKILKNLRAEDFSLETLTHLNNMKMAVVFPDEMIFHVPRSLRPLYSHFEGSTKTHYYFFLDQLILTYLPGVVGSKTKPGMIRMTRDADVTSDLIAEGTGPTPDIIRQCLRGLDRGRPVRMQYAGNMSPDFVATLANKMNLQIEQVFSSPQTLCLHGLWDVVNDGQKSKKLKDLVYKDLPMHISPPFDDLKNVYGHLDERDYILHHPYDSFEGFLKWIQAACSDPSVESIELTIYRIGTLSPLTRYLKQAAKKKKIRICIELRARFDESNNLSLAEELSQAGVEVNFGFGKLKLHAKVALITRKKKGQRRYYTHLSTGNYNAKTAQAYTDMAIVTANQEVGQDAKKFFNAIYSGTIPSGLNQLVIAPTRMHRRFVSLIEAEIRAAQQGKKARIVAKANSLVDETVIASLYRASQQGVKIDLIIRSACSLIPGVPGLSENIRVVSIIDRFLEHSRIYYFESSNAMYLSSADWMPRNFFRRLEIAFPVLDERLRKYIAEVVLPLYLSDTEKARTLTARGTWRKRVPVTRKGEQKRIRAQKVLSQLARRGYEGTPLH